MWDTLTSAILFTGSIVFTFHLGKYSRFILDEMEKKEKKGQKKKKDEKKLFSDLFSQPSSYVNSNIHPELYCYDKLQEIQKKENNKFEQEWKIRVLMENTVYGNIIMFYDIYKQAFVYFSDIQIPYKTLNLCAMKYVRTFLCLDFFVDTTEIPKDYKNPFNEMKKEEEIKEENKKKEKKKKLDVDFDSDVFIKKTLNKTNQTNKYTKSATDTKKTAHSKNKQPEVVDKNKFVNNFRHLGKLQNYSFLQPVPKIEKKEISDNYQYIDFKGKTSKIYFSEKFHDLFR